MDRNIGWDFKKQKSSIPRMKLDKLKKLYKASVLCNNYGDISLINPNELPDFDIFNMSFPCQTFSIAGKRMGVNDFRGTLGFISLKILEVKRPKYFVIENVPGLISTDDGIVLSSMLEIACNSGYHIMTDTLNAKNYGIPQNRNRLFAIGVRDDLINKDKDILEYSTSAKKLDKILKELKNEGKLKEITDFKFPEVFDNGTRLKHLLEDAVDEKYYIDDEKAKKLISEYKYEKINDTSKPNLVGGFGEINFGKQYRQGNRVYDGESIAMCLNAQPVGNKGGYSYLYTCPCIAPDKHEILQVGMLDIKGNEQIRRVYDEKGIPPTLSTMKGGNRQPKVLCNDVFKIGDIPKDILNDNERQRRVYSQNGIAPTTLARTDSAKILEENDFRIRKLTPLECWRLMGFNDEDFYKAKAQGTSDSQLYKQAGNSIVVNVLYYII